MSTPSIHRDASGRLSVEFLEVRMEQYPLLCKKIALEFGLSNDGSIVSNGADVAFAEFGSDFGVVQMAWDNWSGFFVTAISNETEQIVREIAGWLAIHAAEVTNTDEQTHATKRRSRVFG